MILKNREIFSITRFENARQTIGFFLGPLVFLTILFITTPQSLISNAQNILEVNAQSDLILEYAYGTKVVLALMLLMIIWWVTEAVPIPMTALLPAIILPIFHISGFSDGKIFSFNVKNVLVNYANPVIYLFLSGFLLASAMQKWKLDKRLVLFILTRGNLAKKSSAVLLGMMSISAFLSMWISNTATTAMLLPLGIGILVTANCEIGKSNFGKALMLGIAWGASIGGVGTLIGTPPNGICVSILNSADIVKISFLDWMKFGIPYVIIVLPIAWVILIKIFPPEIQAISGGKELLISQKLLLGKWSKGEKLTVLIFFFIVSLWISNPFWKYIFPQAWVLKLEWFDEYVIAILGALLLFVIPVDWKNKKFVLEWQDSKFVDWGTLILFGGGIALSDAMFKTGLANLIATSTISIVGKPSTFLLMAIIILMIDFLTEVTSNTAVTSMMIPIIISIAKGLNSDPVALAVSAAVASSMAFMLPVATPPNAIVYGSGYIKITDMIKGGFVLDIIGWLMTILILYVFAFLIFGLIKI
ncbi:MAG: DASS family sodium-coupled anion symporter [Ignavibacteria bacterium]|nr:DASS family sodium-coupled anion symporter [Ignavibacteria bacterium]